MNGSLIMTYLCLKLCQLGVEEVTDYWKHWKMENKLKPRLYNTDRNRTEFVRTETVTTLLISTSLHSDCWFKAIIMDFLVEDLHYWVLIEAMSDAAAAPPSYDQATVYPTAPADGEWQC